MLKIELFIFTMTWSISKIFSQKLTENHTKHWYLQHWIYYNKKKDDYESIYSVNPLYLLVNHASGYIEEKNENKYLVFKSTDENKELPKNTKMFWGELKTKSKQ